MAIKLTVILFVLLSGVFSLVLEVVRRRSANNPTPESVSDVYDAETYLKWKKYSAEHSTLEIVFTVLGTVTTVALLLTEAYAAFASLFPKNHLMQLLAVVLLESAVGFVFGTVKSYIANMKIEQKYGFNRTSVKTFITDSIRSLLLELLLSFALAGVMAALHLELGDWIALLFAVVMFCFTMVISFLYPILSRIGNKFTPLEDGELKDKLMALLTKHGYRVKAIEVMDASRRTTKLNAYFTGFGKLKTIVLYDNLLGAMTEDEICAIFAHELGHGLNKDVLKGQILNIGTMLVMSATVWVTVSNPELCTKFGFERINYGFAYILVGIFLGLLQPLMGLVTNARSRRAEYRADRLAVKEGYGEAMITAFKKLAKDNFSHLSPSKINVVLEYSHPPLDRRVDAVRAAMKEQDK